MESFLTIYQEAGWFLSKNSTGFERKKFSTNIFNWSDWEHFLSFKVFCKEWKRWKSLGERFGEYGGWGKKDQLKVNIFSSMILAECGLALSWRSSKFLLLTSRGNFLRKILCTRCCGWEYMSELSVWFKNSIWKYETTNITPTWSSTFWVGVRVKVHPFQSTAFCVEHYHNRPIFRHLKNASFLCLERSLVAMDAQFSLFVSLRVWGIPVTFWPLVRDFKTGYVLVQTRDCGNESHELSEK